MTEKNPNALAVKRNGDVDQRPPDEVVRDLAQRGYTARYIARQLGLHLDDFIETYSDEMADALEDMGATLLDALKRKAFDRSDPTDVPAVKLLMDRMLKPDSDYEIIGTRNTARPLIHIQGEITGVTKPKISPAIAKAIEADAQPAKS